MCCYILIGRPETTGEIMKSIMAILLYRKSIDISRTMPVILLILLTTYTSQRKCKWWESTSSWGSQLSAEAHSFKASWRAHPRLRPTTPQRCPTWSFNRFDIRGTHRNEQAVCARLWASHRSRCYFFSGTKRSHDWCLHHKASTQLAQSSGWMGVIRNAEVSLL